MKILKDYYNFISELNESQNSKTVLYEFEFDNQANFEKFFSLIKNILDADYFKNNYQYKLTIEDKPIITKNNTGIIKINFDINKSTLIKSTVIIKNVIKSQIEKHNFNISIKNLRILKN